MVCRSPRYNDGGKVRSPTGHSRPADLEGYRTRPGARLRHCAAPPASLARCGTSSSRLLISRAASPGKSRPPYRGLERDRHGPRSEVLSPHSKRTRSTRNRSRQLGAADGSRRPDPQNVGGRCPMNWWQRLWRRKQMDEQLEKELRYHLEQHASELI